MANYRKADKDLHDLVQTIIDAEKAHEDLHDHGLRVGVLLSEDPVTLHGYDCYAIVRKTGPRERAQGCADAVIIIDEVKWNDLSNELRIALLDHELTHLNLARDKEGDVKLDNLGRPKIKMRLHDWQLGGFTEMFERHGQDAIEVQHVLATADRFGQCFFGFAEVKLPEKSKNGKSKRTKPVIPTIRKAVEGLQKLVGEGTGITSITMQGGDGPPVTITKEHVGNLRLAGAAG